MKNSYVVIGMRVQIPTKKSMGCSIKESNVIPIANAKGQKYLFVTNHYERGFCLGTKNDPNSGDFFLARDFEPYIAQGKKTKKIPSSCLFCGNSKPKVVELQGSHFVACMDCEARGPRKATASDAVVAWNTHITVGVINA